MEWRNEVEEFITFWRLHFHDYFENCKWSILEHKQFLILNMPIEEDDLFKRRGGMQNQIRPLIDARYQNEFLILDREAPKVQEKTQILTQNDAPQSIHSADSLS